MPGLKIIVIVILLAVLAIAAYILLKPVQPPSPDPDLDPAPTPKSQENIADSYYDDLDKTSTKIKESNPSDIPDGCTRPDGWCERDTDRSSMIECGGRKGFYCSNPKRQQTGFMPCEGDQNPWEKMGSFVATGTGFCEKPCEAPTDKCTSKDANLNLQKCGKKWGWMCTDKTTDYAEFIPCKGEQDAWERGGTGAGKATCGIPCEKPGGWCIHDTGMPYIINCNNRLGWACGDMESDEWGFAPCDKSLTAAGDTWSENNSEVKACQDFKLYNNQVIAAGNDLFNNTAEQSSSRRFQ